MNSREHTGSEEEGGERPSLHASPNAEQSGRTDSVPGLGGVVLSADEMKELREQGRDNNP